MVTPPRRDSALNRKPPPVDGFKRGHLTARFIAIALMLIPIVAYFIWRDPGTLDHSATTSGTVLEYQKHIALLKLPGGELVRLYSGPDAVMPGEVLPLIADHFSNGTVQYRVDFKALGVTDPTTAR